MKLRRRLFATSKVLRSENFWFAPIVVRADGFVIVAGPEQQDGQAGGHSSGSGFRSPNLSGPYPETKTV